MLDGCSRFHPGLGFGFECQSSSSFYPTIPKVSDVHSSARLGRQEPYSQKRANRELYLALSLNYKTRAVPSKSLRLCYWHKSFMAFNQTIWLRVMDSKVICKTKLPASNPKEGVLFFNTYCYVCLVTPVPSTALPHDTVILLLFPDL